MIYVADNPEKDFQALQQLGMKSMWFRNKDGLYAVNYLDKTNYINGNIVTINHLEELMGLLNN